MFETVSSKTYTESTGQLYAVGIARLKGLNAGANTSQHNDTGINSTG